MTTKFFNQPLIIFDDEVHSTDIEKRYGALGKTNENRRRAIYFTIQNNKVRIISTRDQGKKDREFLAKHDLSEYFDPNKAINNPQLANLKPSTKTITLHISESLLNALKFLQTKRMFPINL